MNGLSAVEFATERRIHLGLAITNLERSIAFYRVLFGQNPSKIRAGYAKFEVAEPPVNLSLNVVTDPLNRPHPVSHFGIQVKSSEAVQDALKRIQSAGFSTRIEESISCCYAVQDKFWVTDPDGQAWEFFVVLDNEGKTHAATSGCCEMPANEMTQPNFNASACC